MPAPASPAVEPHVARYVDARASHPEADEQAWRRHRVIPRSFSGSATRSGRVEVLGREISTPVMLAPMAQQIAAHPDGEAEAARGTAAAGSLIVVSVNTAIPFARIAASSAPWWFQTYLLADRELTGRTIDRALSTGAEALVLTTDSTAFLRTSSTLDPAQWPSSPAAARLGNLTADERTSLRGRPAIRPNLDDVRWVIERASGVPVVVKGILDPRDAETAARAGAAGLIVSTHGGRAAHRGIAAADALKEVVEAVRDDVEIYVDSGIRSGWDVTTALVAGARAVLVGRPFWWALADNGAAGVEALFHELAEQTLSAMSEAGIASPATATHARIATYPGAPS